MHTQRPGWPMSVAVSSLAGAILVGCGGGPDLTARSLSISLEGSLIESGRPSRPVDVDLLFSKEPDPGKPEDYFAKDESARAAMDLRRGFVFSPSSASTSYTIGDTDPVWSHVSKSKADTLWVITNYPSKASFPLDLARWEEGTMDILIGPAGVRGRNGPSAKE